MGIFICIFTILTSSLFTTDILASVVDATSCSSTHIQAAITSASSGDTVNVPTGECTWTDAITIPVDKTIELIGAGTANTVITYSNPMIQSLSPDSRISGFRFNLIAGVAPIIEVRNKGFRIDHNYFDNQTGSSIEAILADGTNVTYMPEGVIDNNTLNECRVVVYGMATLAKENAVWAEESKLGTENVVYVEDNVITRSFGNAMDANYAGRYVFRFNTVNGVQVMAHSLQGSTERGTKSWEIYGNSFIFTDSGQGSVVAFMRGGTGTYFNNYVTGPASNYTIDFDNVRSFDCAGCGDNPPPDTDDSGMCDGTSLWDGNIESNGWPCRDQIGRGPDTGTDSSVIGKATSSQPVYLWSNKRSDDTYTGVHIANSTDAWIEADRDYYDYSSSFDGTVGTGCGALASRPSTCTTGVGYWATEQSCSDLTDMVGTSPTTPISGTLYKCTATDTWTEYYTPYTYPHPLRAQIQTGQTGSWSGAWR